MDANTIVTLVGSVGFPIFACIGIAVFFRQSTNDYRADIKTLSDNHRSEIDKITEAIKQNETAINNNTLIIQKLLDKLDKEGDD